MAGRGIFSLSPAQQFLSCFRSEFWVFLAPSHLSLQHSHQMFAGKLVRKVLDFQS